MSEAPRVPSMWSYSSVSTWNQCPRKWWAQRVEKLDLPGEEAHRGTVVHEALEHFAMLAPPDRTLAALLELGDAALDKYKEEDGEFTGPGFTRAVRNRLEAAFAVESWQRIPHPTTVEMKITGDTPGGHKFIGYADRVDRLADGTLAVSDFKTGKFSDWAIGSVSKQLASYVGMLRRNGEDVSLGRAIYLGGRASLRSVVRFRFSDDDVAGVFRWFDSTVDEITEAVTANADPATLETNGTPLCNWCPLKATCPGPVDAGIRIRP